MDHIIVNRTKTVLCLAVACLAAVACEKKPPVMPWTGKIDENKDDAAVTDFVVGKVLPKWAEGYMDIHAVNSGRGECTFFVLPDGTTMLVDAGELLLKESDGSSPVAQKPDASTRPYKVYASYIRNFLPAGAKAIDYAVASHYHIDHIGSGSSTNPMFTVESSPNGYKLSGMTALFNDVPYSKIMDNGYPSYDEDSSIPAMEGELSADWVKFVKWAVASKGVKAERVVAGKKQISLVHDKYSYPEFSVLSLAANGDVFDGQQVQNASSSVGNPSSNAFHLKYGFFDYITCGDLVSAPQNRMADYYAYVFGGNGSLEAFKANHHLSSNAWGSGMSAKKFSPRIIVNQSFYKKQPDVPLFTNLLDGGIGYSWEKDVFLTNLHSGSLKENAELFGGGVKDYSGHVVIRVTPGGKKFYVIMLDDTSVSYKLKAFYGPYDSK